MGLASDEAAGSVRRRPAAGRLRWARISGGSSPRRPSRALAALAVRAYPVARAAFQADAVVAGVSDHRLWCPTPDAPLSSRPLGRGVMGGPSEVTDMDLYLMQLRQAT